MQDKTVVITGGTSGIGEVAAVALAKMGARIVLVGRDRSRGNATLGRLRSGAPGLAHSAYFADLSRLADMKRVAAEIADQEPRIDVSLQPILCQLALVTPLPWPTEAASMSVTASTSRPLRRSRSPRSQQITAFYFFGQPRSIEKTVTEDFAEKNVVECVERVKPRFRVVV